MKISREVRVRILPDGKVEVETHGFRGESCVQLSKVLERALAGDGPDADDRVSRELQPEYYQQDIEVDIDVRNRAD